MKLPGITTCLQLIDSTAMLPNIRRHSLMVTRVAATLFDGLEAAGAGSTSPRQLVVEGALMHDISKTACLNHDASHANQGARFCLDHGWPELAEVVEEHVLLKRFDTEAYRTGRFGAKELVFYADKRVRHDEVVSLASRLEYIIERYGRGDATRIGRIHANFASAKELERLLFARLDFPPEQLLLHLIPAAELGLNHPWEQP